QVKVATAGTMTDADGNFNMQVPDEKDALVITAIGYGTKEVKAGDGSDALVVKLETESKELTETIVTANAVKRGKRSLGYSSDQVTAKELNAGGSASPLNALAGKVAGINITTTSNAPGSSSRVVLRGGSSFQGNNQ